MNPLLLLVVVLAVLLTAVPSSAQPAPSELELFCLQDPGQPACRAVMLRYCERNPDEPICVDDDDDDTP